MFAWLTHLRRAHALPPAPEGPTRVDVMARVASPNVVTSPLTGFSAAVIEIVFVDWETLQIGGGRASPGGVDHERFHALGGVRYGTVLELEDGPSTLVLTDIVGLRIVPIDAMPIVLDGAVPPELWDIARGQQHKLAYREVCLRQGDRVRVVATVERARGGDREVLVPTAAERVTLHETL